MYLIMTTGLAFFSRVELCSRACLCLVVETTEFCIQIQTVNTQASFKMRQYFQHGQNGTADKHSPSSLSFLFTSVQHQNKNMFLTSVTVYISSFLCFGLAVRWDSPCKCARRGLLSLLILYTTWQSTLDSDQTRNLKKYTRKARNIDGSKGLCEKSCVLHIVSNSPASGRSGCTRPLQFVD